MFQIEFNLSTLIIIAFAIINIPLAIWIFGQNKNSWTNRLFSLLIIFLTIYLVINTQLYIFKDYSTRLFLGRFIMGNGAILNLLVFLFLSTFPDQRISVSKKLLFPISIITGLLFFTAFTNLIFEGITVSESNIVTPQPGKFLPVFGLHTLGLVLGGIFLIFKRRRNLSGLERTRVNYIFFAFGVLFFLILVFNFFFPVVLKNGDFVPFLPIYILIFLGTVSYAIARHQLFGLRVLATQVFIIILWMVLLANLFRAKNTIDRALDSAILVSSILLGILLIRSVIREVEQRVKLEELTAKLKALDKQKDEFVSMAAHELRAPMAAIKGYVSMVLEGDTGDIPEKARGFLADSISITDRLVRLVNNMLNVSRIEEGRMVYQLETEHLSRLVRTVYSQFIPEAERKGLKYILDIPNEIRDYIYVDTDRLQEVIANFISNAVKYTDKGSIVVRIKKKDENFVRLEVEDTGPGISEEEQKKLFKKFYRVETSVGKTTGTGLGLYISKLLIDKFNGKIGIDSTLGKGSIFWFEVGLVKER